MQTGRLFYLMGASGTGKDSLLHYLRTHLSPASRVMLPQRYITRPADAGGEAHIEITQEAFQRRVAQDGFAMHWQSHGFSYAIGLEIDEWLGEGFHVVLNGSRHYLETAQARYPSLCPVLVRVSHDALFQRLTLRGRENAAEIERRLQRAEALDRQLSQGDFIVLNNDGPLPEAGEALCHLILSDRVQRADTPLVKSVSG
jgi:ribose 1,5-bisphosphokinase